MSGADSPSLPRRPRTLHEELAEDVACIRGDVHGWVGDRPYRVFVVVRSWTGGEPGRGEPTELRRDELRSGPGCGGPTPPRVLLEGAWARSQVGVVEQGRAVLEELDPTYTEAQLVNYGRCAPGEETFVEVTQDERDGDAADRPVRRYLIDGPPLRDPRRFQWVLRLRSLEPQGVFPPAQEAP